MVNGCARRATTTACCRISAGHAEGLSLRRWPISMSSRFSGNVMPGVRQVTAAEAGRVIELLALAFYDDPTWGWAFPDAEKRLAQHRIWWGLYVHSALPYGCAWTTEDGGAVALWTPPGEPELNEENQRRVEPLLRELLGPHADDVLTLLERFDANHPQHPPHHYLGLLGTHPDHRGKGKGMGLVAANLAWMDEGGIPAYLESSNRSNDHRYERLGFVQVAEFSAPGGGPTVACMWRDPP
jgi:GNAT superfamily N-acetyltransferase